ncbi:MAG: peptide deformylase [Planctomycetes bacterium]|nr:peptide deformylase [Planctomycetota bacterium]
MEIVLHPHPDLRRRARPVDKIGDAVRQTAREMADLMFAARGIGLAGNQVAWLRRLVIVCPSGERGAERALVNPEVLAAEGEEIAEEGCLSFPLVYGRVPRAARIRYRYTDLEGKIVEREAEGLEARVVQHEIDHLDGIVFTMRMTPADQFSTRKAVRELERLCRERRGREPAL